jgi:hypothetical protein
LCLAVGHDLVENLLPGVGRRGGLPLAFAAQDAKEDAEERIDLPLSFGTLGLLPFLLGLLVLLLCLLGRLLWRCGPGRAFQRPARLGGRAGALPCKAVGFLLGRRAFVAVENAEEDLDSPLAGGGGHGRGLLDGC